MFWKKKRISLSNSAMLSPEEMRNYEINSNIIHEALAQSEKRMEDLLKTKDGINQKLLILFNGYMPIIIGLLIACFIVAQNNPKALLLFFLAPLACFFIVSIIFFVLAFRGAQHGSIGSNPDFWLRKDTIAGDEKTLITVLSYLVHSYQEGIEQSYASNLKKITLLHAGVYCSVAGLFISFIFFLLGYPLSLYTLPLTGLFLGLAMVTVLVAICCYSLARHY
jgi:hypothetical protein